VERTGADGPVIQQLLIELPLDRKRLLVCVVAINDPPAIRLIDEHVVGALRMLAVAVLREKVLDDFVAPEIGQDGYCVLVDNRTFPFSSDVPKRDSV
jgi:hypothetical protein